MNPVPAVVLTAVALASPLSAWSTVAQAPPDFSGTWTIDRERSESPQQGEGFVPATYVIVQTPTDVTIETQRGMARSTARYVIGAATTPPSAAQPRTDDRPAGRAYWTGASLVIEGLRTVQGQTVSVRETRTLDRTGTEMTLETLLVVQHGYTLKGAQNYGAAKDVYRRQ